MNAHLHNHQHPLQNYVGNILAVDKYLKNRAQLRDKWDKWGLMWDMQHQWASPDMARVQSAGDLTQTGSTNSLHTNNNNRLLVRWLSETLLHVAYNRCCSWITCWPGFITSQRLRSKHRLQTSAPFGNNNPLLLTLGERVWAMPPPGGQNRKSCSHNQW